MAIRRPDGSRTCRPRSNGAHRGPLRRIVGGSYDGPTFVEVLECGHTQLPVRDLIGETNAARRRCRKCKRGAAVDVDPASLSD